MTSPEVLGRVDELRASLDYHNHRYYVRDAPEVSDAPYEGLSRGLRGPEAEHPGVVKPQSPQPRGGAAPRASEEDGRR
mgnify:CR=1 FL=1